MTTRYHGSGWSRRDFLRVSGLGAAALLGSAACSSNGGSSTSGSMSFTYWGSSVEKEAVANSVRNFESTNSGITVNDQHIPQDYETKIQTLIAANNEPDLAYIGPAMSMRLAEQGRLANILDHADEYPGISEMLPNVVHQWEPGKAVNQLCVEMMLMWYNADVFQAAGVQPPPADPAAAWTWDDYVEAADRLTIDQNGTHPSESGFDHRNVKQWGTLAPTWPPAWYGLLWGNGGDLVNDDGTMCTLDTTAAVEVLQAISDLIYEHRVAPTPTQSEANAATSAVQLQTQRVAMIIDGQWQLLDLGTSDFNYDVAFIPRFQEPLTANLCNANVIFNSSEQQEKAVELLLYLADPDEVDLYADGLWMPLQEKYYTDPDAIASWVDNPVHPPGYEMAALEGLRNYSRPEPAYRVRNFEAFDQRYTPVLEELWDGDERDAKKVAAAAVEAGTPLLQGLYPGTLENGG